MQVEMRGELLYSGEHQTMVIDGGAAPRQGEGRHTLALFWNQLDREGAPVVTGIMS